VGDVEGAVGGAVGGQWALNGRLEVEVVRCGLLC
jgi:hypothetical protein